ncbi:SDR family oxidoreductase [Agromyces sp. SYSU T00194]|uniref:SDR family oxidoreductase n=1 Tax=Agromyces chitinivorans TaxID=3158560 RepID=UPI00339B7ADC
MSRSPLQLPDWHGRRALVTGASSGVGVEVARALAGAGAEVLMPVRDRGKGERVADEIRASTPDAQLHVRDLDLAVLDSVRGLADALRREERPIDLLVLNAGVVLLGEHGRRVTVDGNELHLQVNFLGHAALVLGLLPLLRRRGARVAIQCSLAAATARIDWDDPQPERRYAPMRAYAASKLALGLFGMELGRRSAEVGWGIRVNLCHPGVAPGTGIAPAVRALVPPVLLHAAEEHTGNPPAQAAEPALLALASEGDGTGFFGPSGVLQLAGPGAEEPAFRRLRSPTEAARAWRFALDRVGSGRPAGPGDRGGDAASTDGRADGT